MFAQVRRVRGFTMVELLVVVAVLGVLLTLAAPSFSEFTKMQRMKSINAQVITDIQYARTEAVSRNVPVHLRFQPATSTVEMSCYVLYTTNANPVPPRCDCRAAEGLRCTNAATAEIRTVQVPTSLSVLISATGNDADNFSFDPRTGGMLYGAVDYTGPTPAEYLVDVYIDSPRKLRDKVNLSGRVQACKPSGSTVPGAAC